MSWWTNLRDGVETAAALVANYYYPGLGLLGEMFNSKGSQAQLGSALGQVAMFGTGAAGGAAGNFSNYGTTIDAIGTGASGIMSSGGQAVDYSGGISGTSTLGGTSGITGTSAGGAFDTGSFGSNIANPDAVAAARSYIDQGYTAQQAAQAAGLTQQQAQASGLVGWGDSGAGPGVTGQAMTGAAGNPGTGFNVASGGGAMGQTAGQAGGTPFAAASPSGAGTAGGIQGQGWGSPSNLMTMGSGLYGLAQSANLAQMAKQAQAAADPFAPYRKQYADQLAALEADPNSITKLPGYQAGIQAVQRSMNAQGYGGSGNMATALQKYGGDFYNNAVSQLSGLAGAQFNPATAAQIGLQGQQSAIGLAGQSLNRLGYGTQLASGFNPYAINNPYGQSAGQPVAGPYSGGMYG